MCLKTICLLLGYAAFSFISTILHIYIYIYIYIYIPLPWQLRENISRKLASPDTTGAKKHIYAQGRLSNS